MKYMYIGVQSLQMGCTQSPSLLSNNPNIPISYLTFAVHVLSLGTFNDYWPWPLSEYESEWSDCEIFRGQHIACFKIALRGGLVRHFMSYPFPIKWPEWPCLILAKWPGWTFHVLSSSSPKWARPRPLFNVILLPPLPQMRCPTTQQAQPIIGKRFSSP